MILSLLALAHPVPPQEPAAEQLLAARAAIEALAAANQGAAAIQADYVQRRYTELLERPLVSSGRFHHRSDPGCLAFHALQPRQSIIRLDPTSYTVFRPVEARAEVFEFGTNHVAKLLLMLFRPSLAEIERVFRIAGSASEDEVVHVVLMPRQEEVAKLVPRVELTIRTAKPALVGIAYTDSQGDRIAIELSNVLALAKAPAGEFLDELPKGTRVIRHLPEQDAR